jgi:hypothetical protein
MASLKALRMITACPLATCFKLPESKGCSHILNVTVTARLAAPRGAFKPRYQQAPPLRCVYGIIIMHASHAPHRGKNAPRVTICPLRSIIAAHLPSLAPLPLLSLLPSPQYPCKQQAVNTQHSGTATDPSAKTQHLYSMHMRHNVLKKGTVTVIEKSVRIASIAAMQPDSGLTDHTSGDTAVTRRLCCLLGA